MANTRKVLLSLHDEVAAHLDAEPNKSALVDALVAAHYGLTFEGSTAAASNRQSILDQIKASTATQEPVAAPEVPVDPIVEPEPVIPAPVTVDVTPTTTTEPVPVVVESVGDVNANPVEPITVAPPEGEAQPVAAFVPVALDTGFVPQVQPLEAVPEVAPVVEPVQPEILPTQVPSLVEAVAAASAVIDPPLPTPVPEPVSVQVEPGTVLNPEGQRICPTCKEPMITPVCLNCL